MHPSILVCCAGTRLGSTCWPDSFTNLLDVVSAYMPTINWPLTFVFVSRTSPAAMGTSSWLLDMQAPGAVPAQPLGAMQHWPDCPLLADNATYFAYRLVVPGRSLVSVSVQSCLDWRVPSSPTNPGLAGPRACESARHVAPPKTTTLALLGKLATCVCVVLVPCAGWRPQLHCQKQQHRNSRQCHQQPTAAARLYSGHVSRCIQLHRQPAQPGGGRQCNGCNQLEGQAGCTFGVRCSCPTADTR